MDMNKGIAFGLNWQLDKGHIRFTRSPAAFFDIAAGTGADDVFPGRFAAGGPRNNVIQ